MTPVSSASALGPSGPGAVAEAEDCGQAAAFVPPSPRFAAVAFDFASAPLAFSVALWTEPQKSRLQVRGLVAVASALVVALAAAVSASTPAVRVE